MAKRPSKFDKHIDTTVEAAMGDAISEFESLAGEMRDWYDNMPENLQSGSKGDSVGEAADTLEGISEVEVPDAIKDLKVEYTERQQKTSRSARRDYACRLLQGAIDEAQSWMDDEANAEHEDFDAVGSFLDEAQSALDEAEGVDFPGMMG